jgi:hypothetical protein
MIFFFIIWNIRHGQSPQKPDKLIRIDDGKIMSAMNVSYNAYRRKLDHSWKSIDFVPLVANDDSMQIWLTDRSLIATKFAKNFLMSYSGTGTGINPLNTPTSFVRYNLILCKWYFMKMIF